MQGHYSVDSILTEELESVTPPARVIEGTPVAFGKRLYSDGRVDIGIWEVTPGIFGSVKTGLSEFMHFVSGSGHIEHTDGTKTVIAPGVILHVLDGWSGTWTVTETVRKCYTVVHTPPASDS